MSHNSKSGHYLAMGYSGVSPCFEKTGYVLLPGLYEDLRECVYAPSKAFCVKAFGVWKAFRPITPIVTKYVGMGK